MIEEIQNNEELEPFIRDSCSENNINVSFENNINEDEYVIIKPDDYYNSLGLAEIPPSVDCLIVQNCENGYRIYLFELKNINSPDGFDKDHIREKFRTVLTDFMSNRFREIFYTEDNQGVVFLHFISDPYGIKEGRNRRHSSLLYEIFNNVRPLEFANKKTSIDASLPDFEITKC